MGVISEYFVGPVMEKIIEKCFEYFKDQVKWKTGMEELKKLQVIHPQIQAFVSDYNHVEIEVPALNKWYWQLRDAVDEADNVLDDVLNDLLEYRRKHEEQASTIRSKGMADPLEHSLEIYQIGVKNDSNLKRLEDAVHKLYEISAEVSTFRHFLKNIKQKKQRQLEMSETREAGSMPANDLFGRSKEMGFVKHWLINPYPTGITNTDFYKSISVLSVVGHGGMGKTTLLQHVFSNRLTEVFDVKIWVCVSTNFKAKIVITNMLKFLKKQVSDEEPLAALQSTLQSEVMSKRFLLVMDDIWEEDEGKLENVLAPLRYGYPGSKILITTRLDSVASMFANMIKKSKETLSLKGLVEDEFLQLLNINAFAGVKNSNDEFRSIVVKMVQKFSGCPLAAKVIRSTLNDHMDERNWEKVLNTNIGNIESEQNQLFSVLKLSYIYLPKFLQNCFAFCCIFPQDYEFDRDDLVRMWIALGFIQSSNIQGKTLEDTGRGYFNILVQKSFFDEFHNNDYNKVCYKMHGLLHELAQSVFTQECYKFVDNEELRLPIPPETIRHLSITTNCSGLEAALQNMRKFKKLRSLFLFCSGRDEDVISEILKASINIRLLVISCWNMPKMPETIGCLTHLRYLKIENSDCNILGYGVELPRSINHLYPLQFIFSKILALFSIGWKASHSFIVNELFTKDPYVLNLPSSLQYIELADLPSLQCLPSSLSTISSLKTLILRNIMPLKSLPDLPISLNHIRITKVPLLLELPNLPSSLRLFELIELESLRCLPSCLSTDLDRLSIRKVPRLLVLPELPSCLRMLELRDLESLQCLPSCFATTLKILWIIKVPRLLELPDLPVSLEELCIEDCDPQLMERYSNF